MVMFRRITWGFVNVSFDTGSLCLVELIDVRDSRKHPADARKCPLNFVPNFNRPGHVEGAHVIADNFSDLPSPAEAGFAKTGNRVPSFAIML
jgi:hypothetical protein